MNRIRQAMAAVASGQDKRVIIYPAAVLMALVMSHTGLGLVFFARDHHHASPVSIGWLGGIWALTYTIGCLGLRPHLRRLLPWQQVVLSAAAQFVIVAAMQVAPSLAWLFVLQALFGLALSLYWPSLMGWLSTGVEGGDLGRAVSGFNMSWCVGNIIGPYLCGWLLHLDVRAPLAVAAGLALLLAVLLGLSVKLLPGLHAGEPAPETGEEAAEDRSTPLRYPAWAGHFAVYFGMGIVFGIFPVGAREQLGFPETMIGFLLLMRSVTNTVQFWIMGRTTAWHFRMAPMLLGPLLCALAFIGLMGAHSVLWVTLLFGVLGAAGGASYSQSIFHAASGSRDRAHRAAVHEALIGTGIFLGSVMGGFVYERWALAGVNAMGAGVLLGAMVVQVVLYRVFGSGAQGAARSSPGSPSVSRGKSRA